MQRNKNLQEASNKETLKNGIIIPVIISALCSGLLSVFLMNYLNNRNEIYNKKLETLSEFVGYRHDIKGDNFTQALNKAFILFSDSEKVLKAIKTFHEDTQLPIRKDEISNQKLLEVFKAMCADLGIETDELNDEFFLKPFNIKRYSDKPD